MDSASQEYFFIRFLLHHDTDRPVRQPLPPVRMAERFL